MAPVTTLCIDVTGPLQDQFIQSPKEMVSKDSCHVVTSPSAYISWSVHTGPANTRTETLQHLRLERKGRTMLVSLLSCAKYDYTTSVP